MQGRPPPRKINFKRPLPCKHQVHPAPPHVHYGFTAFSGWPLHPWRMPLRSSRDGRCVKRRASVQPTSSCINSAAAQPRSSITLFWTVQRVISRVGPIKPPPRPRTNNRTSRRIAELYARQSRRTKPCPWTPPVCQHRLAAAAMRSVRPNIAFIPGAVARPD